MKYPGACSLSAALLLLCSCGVHQVVQPAPPPTSVPKKVLVAPIGRHWQVIEEAPTLTNERNEQRLPFQMEQSLQPPGTPPAPPEKSRTIETPSK
jgi:hypothetical protein